MITLSDGNIEYISITDSAVADSATSEQFQKYIATLDRKLLPLKEDGKPTVFKLGRLTRRQATWIKGKPEEEQDVWRVAYGVKGVSGFLVNGDEIRANTQASDVGERLDDKTLDLMFDETLFRELASVIGRLARISPLGG